MKRPHAFRLLLVALLIGCVSGCAERGDTPPQIERLGSTSSETRNHTIRVATANLWGVSVLGFDWAEDIDARFAEFAEGLARNAPELDVVLIQEAWKNSARRALLGHEGVIRNFPHRVDANESPGGAGLVVLSRLPIDRAEFHRFRGQGNCFKFWEGDCLSGKGVLALRLEIGGEFFWVGNTHFIACYSDQADDGTSCDALDPNGETRWSQLVEAREFMERLAGETPALLGGDFNLTRSSLYYPGMTSSEIPSNTRESESSKPSSPASRGWTEMGEASVVDDRIDYVWTRPGSHNRLQPAGAARLIFTEPVELDSGRSIPLSDHPILVAPFCLVRIAAGRGPTACEENGD